MKKLAALTLAAGLALGGLSVAPPALAGPVAVSQAQPMAQKASQAQKDRALVKAALKRESKRLRPKAKDSKVKYLGTTTKSRISGLKLVKSKLVPGIRHKYRVEVDMRKALSHRSCHCIG